MTNTSRAAYDSLTKVFNQVIALGGVQNRLYRDMQTTLPKGGAVDHDVEVGVLAELAHEKIADPRVAAWLDEAEKNRDALTKEEQANLRAMRRWHRQEAGLPASLVAALKQAETEGERLHTAEKPVGDWEKVLPFFEGQLALVRQAAEVKQKQIGAATPYDALLDTYSAGWTTKDFDRLFDELEPFLKKLLPDVTAEQAKRAPLPKLDGPFTAEAEEKLSRKTIERMGFDFDRGVLYFIPDHPQAGGTPNDVRIAGRPDPDNFLAPLYDLLHEAGHGLYDQNVPQKWKFQPAGQALGMDLHESQALIWEFVVGKGKEFSVWLSGAAKEAFVRENDDALSAENLFARNTHVTPALGRISIETSEVTYLLHIIMRYRLEKQLFDGTLVPKDLPEAWNRMSEDMFGRRPANNGEGVMQDVHWFAGMFGYFPSYALGFMGAAQFYAAAVRADSTIPAEIEKGNFKPLQQWLADNVHAKGSLLTAKELFIAATGEDLGAKPLKDHLTARYLGKVPVGKETPAPGQNKHFGGMN